MKEYKYIIQLCTRDKRYAVGIDWEPGNVRQRAQLYDPGGGWEDAQIMIIGICCASKTSRMLAIERLIKKS